MSRIMEETGAVLYVKGQHVEPALKHRTQLAPGVKYLHVEIIAPTPIQVQRARCVSGTTTFFSSARVVCAISDSSTRPKYNLTLLRSHNLGFGASVVVVVWCRHAVYELVESIALKSLNLSSTQRQAMGRYSVV